MKAEHKFPRLIKILAREAVEAAEDLRTVLSHWDATQWVPENDWLKQTHHPVLGMDETSYTIPAVIEWDGERWIESRGARRFSPTHICALP